MRRMVFLGGLVVLVALQGAAAISARPALVGVSGAVGPPAIPAPGYDWPQFRGGPWHGGENPFEGVLGPGNVSGLTVRWKFHLDPNVVGSTVVKDGVVYIGAEADGNLYALRESDGTLKWKAQAGGLIGSTPAVSNGLVFVASGGKLYAFHKADGSLAWSAATGGEFSSPVVVAGVVFVGSENGGVYAFEAADGRPLWQAALGSEIDASPAVADGTLFVGTTDGTFYALDAATGARLWTYAAGRQITGSAAVRGDAVYVTSWDGTIFALDRSTGALRWRKSAGTASASSPAVAGNAVYFAVVAVAHGVALERIQARRRSDGRLLWSHTSGSLVAGGVIEPSPSVANGVVYAPSYDGTISAFAADTGALLWQYTDSGFFASPAVVDGQVFIAAGGSGNVYDFALPLPTRPPSP